MCLLTKKGVRGREEGGIPLQLTLTGSNESINNNLSSIRKIADCKEKS